MRAGRKGYSTGTLRVLYGGGLTDARGRAALRPAASLMRYLARLGCAFASNGHCECYAYGFAPSRARLGGVRVSVGVRVRLRVRVLSCALACDLRVRDAGSVMSSFRRSFLRIQPLTWHPVGSGGSLRLGACPCLWWASVRALMRAMSEPAADAARSALAAEGFSRGRHSAAPSGRGRPGLRFRRTAEPLVVLRRLSGRADGCARGYYGGTARVLGGTTGATGYLPTGYHRGYRLQGLQGYYRGYYYRGT
jgi:hypothetical protein